MRFDSGLGLIVGMVAFGYISGTAVAQGTLTPPGPPGPTMKTLQQVEPRTPVTNLPYTISSPGSYYLQSNLTGTAGIDIETGNVTLDLNGFALFGQPEVAAVGIAATGLSDLKNITVRNGTVHGWADGGIDLMAAGQCAVTDVRAISNGYSAVSVGPDSAIARCQVVSNPDTGLQAMQSCRVTDCVANGNGTYGILAGDNCVVQDCTANANAGYGVSTGFKSTVTRCTANGNLVDGIHCFSQCVVADNTCVENGLNTGTGAGVHAMGNANRIERNHCAGADYGLQVDGTDNYVAGNTVRDNEVNNYNIAQGNQLNILLCEIPETIQWPADVKLAGTLSTTQTGVDGITVASDNVTIDMGGHALIGPGTSSGDGIFASSKKNLRVFNGKLTDWRGTSMKGINAGSMSVLTGLQTYDNYIGIQAGVCSTLSDCTARGNLQHGFSTFAGCTVSDCTGYDNGEHGFHADFDSTFTDCTAGNNAQYGFNAGAASTLSGCMAGGNGLVGFYAADGCALSGCSAQNNVSAVGIWAQDGCLIRDCTAYENGDPGIQTYSNCEVSKCTVSGNSGDGIYVGGSGTRVSGCIVTGNGVSHGLAGIRVVVGFCLLDGNQVHDNGVGIAVEGSPSFIARNFAGGNGTNWVVASGNDCLVIQATRTGSAFSGNFGGDSPGSTDPNANFTY